MKLNNFEQKVFWFGLVYTLLSGVVSLIDYLDNAVINYAYWAWLGFLVGVFILWIIKFIKK
jgi:uncharacterized membrane protein YGL010W